MSPRSMFHSCGSSSRLVARSARPSRESRSASGSPGVALRPHGAELQDGELRAVEPDPALPEQHRAARVAAAPRAPRRPRTGQSSGRRARDDDVNDPSHRHLLRVPAQPTAAGPQPRRSPANAGRPAAGRTPPTRAPARRRRALGVRARRSAGRPIAEVSAAASRGGTSSSSPVVPRSHGSPGCRTAPSRLTGGGLHRRAGEALAVGRQARRRRARCRSAGMSRALAEELDARPTSSPRPACRRRSARPTRSGPCRRARGAASAYSAMPFSATRRPTPPTRSSSSPTPSSRRTAARAAGSSRKRARSMPLPTTGDRRAGYDRCSVRVLGVLEQLGVGEPRRERLGADARAPA